MILTILFDSTVFMTRQEIAPGVYRHFKGEDYRVFWIARMSENPDQEVVVYQKISTGEYWVRPVNMFVEQVMINDVAVPRFAFKHA